MNSYYVCVNKESCTHVKTAIRMNRSFLQYIPKAIAIFTMLSMTSCSTYRQAPTREMIQKAGVITDALDSICIEGYNLYVAEYVNWVSSDSLLAHYRMDEIGNNFIWQPTNDTWNVIFMDREQKKCIFEFRYDISTKEQTISYDSRPISETERGLLEKKNLMQKKAIEQYGDSIRYNPDYGRPNFDFVRIDTNTTRMYILQGVERSGIIPFGNDYSVDFDNDCNITAFRRYHRSFIPIPNDGETVYHSHLKDNPYITPTDICNFLLYHGNMKETVVLSTALNGYIIYNVETHTATFITYEMMDTKNDKKS